ncbi:MAG: DNA-processing protein DprA [Acidimicrobiia bacterium]|nr:DNA-processing protein DprA [Acidimicrobiia bacterium]
MSDDASLRLACGGLHPERVRELLARFRTPGGAVRAIETGRVRATDQVRGAVAVPAEQRRKELAAEGVRFLTASGGAYPPHLAGAGDGPPFLFLRGELPPTPGIAVVGTRRCTAYGRRIAHSYGRALGSVGVPVISGLARGIDAAAHLGTLTSDGVGVAVMGCGLDRIYPREHRALLHDLLAGGGAVVGEYPLGAPPLAWRFPARNRIISLLAVAVVVVEANVTGGALITARHALDQGREVLATPGDISRRSSAGTNNLIRDGAIPVFDADDLLGAVSLMPEFGWLAFDADRDGDDTLLSAISMSGTSMVELLRARPEPEAVIRAELRQLAESGCIVVEGDTLLRVSPRFRIASRHR